MSSLLRLERQQKTFLKLRVEFAYFSFFVIYNTFIHYLSLLEDHTRFQTEVGKVYTRFLWLAIRFKIMTSCTWAFLPRIIVYNRYVWAFIPYTTIYIAYIRVFNTRICAKSNARLYALLKTRIYAYLSKPTYTRAKMCIYAGFRNQTWYKMARKVPLTE